MLDVVSNYLDYLKYQKNYSDHTIDSYRRDIEKFLNYMNDEGYTLESVNIVLIRNFLAHETIDRISKRSNARRIVAMRRFYDYLVREEIVNNNPFYSVMTPKIEKKLPEFLYAEDLMQLLKA